MSTLAAAAAVAFALPGVAYGSPSGGGPVVRTTAGAVQGTTAAGVDTFLGVRYAQPPVGALRWQPPQPAQPWTGIAPATAAGSACPQLPSGGPGSTDEDCLFLNVQRPAGVAAGEDLPVFVYFHGGSATTGNGAQYDGVQLIQQGGIVVVTVNYRLGMLGFLAHLALRAEQGRPSGDYGFLDQQAALRWVHANIGRFGGDPGRVTIGGESAGAWFVCAHLTAPGSRGLFAQAIMSSGPTCGSMSEDDAIAAAQPAVDALGCPMTGDATALACLRGLGVDALLQAGETWGWGPNLVSGAGTALPKLVGPAIAAGDFARVPVLVGANLDETRIVMVPWTDGFKQEDYERTVGDIFDGAAGTLIAQYPWPATYGEWTAAYLLGKMFTDGSIWNGIGGCLSQRQDDTLAGYTRVYAYEFAYRDGPGPDPIPGFAWGAAHTVELPYLWPTLSNAGAPPVASTFNEAEKQLARDMTAYWVKFIRTGHPNSAGGPMWPQLRPKAGTDAEVMSLRAGGQSALVTDAQLAAEHECAFWQSLPWWGQS